MEIAVTLTNFNITEYSYVSDIFLKYNRVLIAGDLNIHVNDPDDPDAMTFEEIYLHFH